MAHARPEASGTSADSSLILFVSVMVGSLALNFVFASAQAALASIGLNAIEAIEESRSPLARRLTLFFTRLPRLEHLFGRAALFMFIAFSLLAARIGAELVTTQPIIGAILGAIVAFLVQIIGIEAIGRNLAMRNPARALAIFVPLAYILSVPFIVLLIPAYLFSIFPGRLRSLATLSDMHLRLMPNLKGIERVVDEEAFELIDSVREFAESTAIEIMTPRTEVVAIPNNLVAEEIYDRLRASEYSRVVVYAGTIDSVVGTLLAKEVLLQRPDNPYSLLRQPIIASEKTRLPELLKMIRTQRSHLVIIIDEYGGMSGIVTLHDLFEVIVGHMEDVEDRDEFWIEQMDDYTYRLNGRIEVWEINEEFNLELDEELARTVGGLVFNTLGRVPEVGDDVRIGDVSFKVEKLIDNRVEAVVLKLVEQELADVQARERSRNDAVE